VPLQRTCSWSVTLNSTLTLHYITLPRFLLRSPMLRLDALLRWHALVCLICPTRLATGKAQQAMNILSCRCYMLLTAPSETNYLEILLDRSSPCFRVGELRPVGSSDQSSLGRASPHRHRQLDRFSRFCRVHAHDQQDTRTTRHGRILCCAS